MGDPTLGEVELQPFRRRGLRNFDRGVRRYEPVVAVVCVVVLLARYGPGGGDRDVTLPFSAPPIVVSEPTIVDSPSVPSSDASSPVARPEFGARSNVQPPVSGASEAAPSTAPTAPTAPAAPPSSDATPVIGSVSLFAAAPDGRSVDGIATAADGSVFLGTTSADGKAALLHLGADGEPRRMYDLSRITGEVSDVIVGPGQVVLVLGASPARVVALNTETGEELALADIPNVLPCLPVVATTNCDGSLVDRPPRAESFAFNPAGDLYITDSNQGAVWRMDRGEKTPYQVVVSADLAGPAGPTGGKGVQGIAVDDRGTLVFATERLGEGPGAVLIQPVSDDGVAGQRAELYRATAAEGPVDVALSRSGRVYVALRGTGQLLSIASSGGDASRVPAQAGALGAPGGMAFGGTGVFVSTTAADQTPSNVILRVEVGEQGRTQATGGRE